MPETVGKIGDDDDGTQGTCARRTTGFFFSLSLSLSLLYHRDKRQQQRNGSASFSLLCWVESASMRVTVGQTSQFITISLPASIPKVNWKHSSNQYRTHPLCLFASLCWFGERRELYLDLNLVALVSCLIFLSLLYFYFNVAQFLLLLPFFFFSLFSLSVPKVGSYFKYDYETPFLDSLLWKIGAQSVLFSAG